MDIHSVELSKQAKKDLTKVPSYIALKLYGWIEDVGIKGLFAVRKIPSYHDEPLKGQREGQRSIRLSKGYRAIYVIGESGTIHFINIIEVNKHDY